MWYDKDCSKPNVLKIHRMDDSMVWQMFSDNLPKLNISLVLEQGVLNTLKQISFKSKFFLDLLDRDIYPQCSCALDTRVHIPQNMYHSHDDSLCCLDNYHSYCCNVRHKVQLDILKKWTFKLYIILRISWTFLF